MVSTPLACCSGKASRRAASWVLASATVTCTISPSEHEIQQRIRSQVDSLISPLHCNAPCWIRTSDRLLGRLAVVGLKTLAVTGFFWSKSARCEQKCEQFAGFRPLMCLPSGSWEGVIAVSAMPPFAELALSDQQVLADRLI